MNDDQREKHPRMPLYVRMLFGAIVGVPMFAYIGTFLSCEVLMPWSNLCGLLPWMLAIPLGAPLGAALGALLHVLSADR